MEYPNYNPASDFLPLNDEELSTLDDMLNRIPVDAAMNIEAMDGYLTALLMSPRRLQDLSAAVWLPNVWGGDDVSPSPTATSTAPQGGQAVLGSGPADDLPKALPEHYPFVSGKQRKRVQLLVLRHLQSIKVCLSERPQAWEPIFSIAIEDEQEYTDAEDWCVGFMLGVDSQAEAWAPRFAESGDLLAAIALLGGDEAQLNEADRARVANLDSLDELSRSVPDAVQALWAKYGLPAKG